MEEAMSSKVYKLWMVRPRAAWYQLSEEEQNDLMARNDADLKKLGVKTLAICDSLWSSEQWAFFGLEEYPDLAAVQAHASYLSEIDYFKYAEARIMLGSEPQPT
jgi:hypothetical protein